MLNEPSTSGWQLFAVQNHLTFKPASFLLMREACVTGTYAGYSFHLDTVSRATDTEFSPQPWRFGTYTRMVLRADPWASTTPSKPAKTLPDSGFDGDRVLDLLMPAAAQAVVKGQFYAFENGREIVYEQEGLETEAAFLQFVLGLLKDLIEIYPDVVELGGEVIPILHPLTKKYHVLQDITCQLLVDISQDTTKRLKKRAAQLVCRYCWLQYGAHQVHVPGLGDLTYYGCRLCGQSRNFVALNEYRLVMVLDRQLTAPELIDNETIRINWIRSPKLIDFEEVEIGQASDEEVERFAVQIGNDTDPIRSSGYKQMRCLISDRCKLSENSLRILRQTFGQVEEKEVDEELA